MSRFGKKEKQVTKEPAKQEPVKKKERDLTIDIFFMIFLLIASVVLCAYHWSHVDVENGVIDPDTNPTLLLYTLLEEDEVGDGRSVEWDGEKASFVEDPMDSVDILDGYGDDPLLSFTSKTLNVQYPSCFTVDTRAVERKGYVYFSCSDMNCHVTIEPIDYGEEVARRTSNENFREIDNFGLRKDRVKYFKSYKTYVGLQPRDGGDTLAGYTLLLESNLTDTSYKIEVYGLGDMGMMRRYALTFMNSIDIVWE